MKIFNRENDQLVVYLQRKNIKAIIKYEDKAPKTIYNTAKEMGIHVCAESNTRSGGENN